MIQERRIDFTAMNSLKKIDFNIYKNKLFLKRSPKPMSSVFKINMYKNMISIANNASY